MTEDVRNMIFPISRITKPKTRRALVYAFGDGSKGIMATEILSFLAFNYIDQLKKNQLDNGFMTKTVSNIQHGTGTGKDTVRGYLGWLAEKKLIETVTGGLDNRTKIKVNMTELEVFITKAEEVWEEIDSLYKKAENHKISKAIERRTKGMRTSSMASLNETVWDNDPVKVEATLKDSKYKKDWIYVWLFNHYYKKYTGQLYQWSELKINTMRPAWISKGLRNGTEYGISKAIAQALKSGENDYRYFEERFKVHYDPDLKPGEFRPGEEKIMVFYDNLRNL